MIVTVRYWQQQKVTMTTKQSEYCFTHTQTHIIYIYNEKLFTFTSKNYGRLLTNGYIFGER